MEIPDGLLRTLILATALGSGLMAGLFLTFSVSVMKALGRLRPAEGMAAMQSINVVIVNPLFLTVFLGTAVGCLVVVIVSVMRSGSVLLILGGALYLLGGLLVTMVFNVPRNNVLASLAPTDPDNAGPWSAYVSEWTAWNHVRTVASLGAAASLTLGLCA